MRIGIEGHRLFRPRKFGMDIVALELIKHLQQIDHVNEYVIFVKPDADSDCIPSAPNFRIVEIHSALYPFWEQFELPRIALREKCDVLHCTSNTAPLFCKIPVITTLHDIIFLEKDYLFSTSATMYQRFGNLYRRLIVGKVVKNSKKVVTVSQFEKNQIKAVFGINDCCLKVIYNGVSSHFRLDISEQDKMAARVKHHLPQHFVLFMANTDPKKNTLNTLRGFAEFKRHDSDDTQLVVMNFTKKNLEKSLRYIGCEDIAGDIVLTDYLGNNEIPAIMSQSQLFLYTSLRESFGIPLLEAMACGVPVVASCSSAIPEIAADAALLCDPNNPSSIAGAIRAVIQSQSLQQKLREKGQERVNDFSWLTMAQQYMELYLEFSTTK